MLERIRSNRMTQLSDAKLSEAETGRTVHMKILDVDRGCRGDPRSLIAVVLKCADEMAFISLNVV